jgi:cell division protein FtsL
MATLVLGSLHAERRQTSIDLLQRGNASQHNCAKFEQQRARRRGPTPEMFIVKHIDNTRLVKADDPERRREMASFTFVITLLFMSTMIYVWQHFSAIEVGYNIETQKTQVEQLSEENRKLRLSEAELSNPSRIDHISKYLGMNDATPNQLGRQDEPDGRVIAQRQFQIVPND